MRVWTPSIVYRWLPLWTSNSCASTVVFHRRFIRLTTSGKSTGSANRQRSDRCATCYGRTRSKITATRTRQNILHTTVSEAVRISTGKW